MEIKNNWKLILTKAWSVRFMLLAAALSGLEVIIPVFSGSIPRNTFAALSLLCTVAAFIARFVAQKDFNAPPTKE